MRVLIVTFTLFTSVIGPVSSSVLGHECPVEIFCPDLGSCTEVYETGIVYENSACASCPVCIDNSIPLDGNGCPDRKAMCEEAPPQHCIAERVFEYDGKKCNYCDENMCVEHTNTQFVGS